MSQRFAELAEATTLPTAPTEVGRYVIMRGNRVSRVVYVPRGTASGLVLDQDEVLSNGPTHTYLRGAAHPEASRSQPTTTPEAIRATSCPRGDPTQGRPHNYHPIDPSIPIPLILCRRCGLVTQVER